MTLPTIEQLEAMLANATPGPWTGHNMVHADHGGPMTPEEIGEYVSNSVKIGDPDRFLFISGKHDDGGYADVCHTGNGPRGMYNTALIALAPTLATQRIADAKRIAELEAAKVTVQEAAKVLLAAIDAHNFDVVVGACFGEEAASRVMQDSKPIVFARIMLTATINYLDPSLDYLRAGADAKVATP